MMKRPPTSCIPPGSWSSSSQAQSTAKSTSVSPRNDASRAPRCRTAPIPATYEKTAATSDSPSTGTTQLVVCRPKCTEPYVACSGSAPTTPKASRATAPTVMPAAAIANGGSGSSVRADSRKNDASPTAAPSPHSTPIRSTRWLPVRSRIRTRPTSAPAEPARVSGCGRSPWRIHCQSTTSTMPRYSSSSATPTESRCTA